MNLLPKNHQEFASADYWGSFFKKRGQKAFDWYGEYQQLCGILHKYIKPKDHILNIGCGTSKLSEDLYDMGHNDIINIDISEVAIRQMKSRNAKQRPNMTFETMDLHEMKYGDGEFSVVLDKATLDALLPEDSEEYVTGTIKMFREIQRVLRIGGRYVCFSLAQPHIVKSVLNYFPNEGWMVRIHCLHRDGVQDSENTFPLPVFAIICTKFNKMPQAKQILEFCVGDDGSVERQESIDQLREAIQNSQNYAMIRHNIQSKSQTDEQLSLDLCAPGSDSPRFTLTVVDQPNPVKNKFAIFIVPQGREVEWLYGTHDGRLQIAASAGHQRVVIVTLHRGQQYESLASIQKELSSKVMELAPRGVEKTKVPFLSLGDDVGNRCQKVKGHSEFSGDFVVEDIQSADASVSVYRRLVFLDNQNLVQSEARLCKIAKESSNRRKKNKKKSGSYEFVVDADHLSSVCHQAMVTGLSLVGNIEEKIHSELRVLLIGLGGGSIPLFVHKHFTKVHLDVVELDPAMVTVARDWFSLPQDQRLKVVVQDGLEFIQQKADSLTGDCSDGIYDAVLFDVDSKDISKGMSAPPTTFIESSFLEQTKRIIKDKGLLIINLSCRNTTLKEKTLQDLSKIFPHISVVSIEEEVNNIVYLCKEKPSQTNNVDPTVKWHQAARMLGKVAQQQCADGQTLEIDLSDHLRDLKIL